jgi:mono/diheme cytochrome c family protein
MRTNPAAFALSLGMGLIVLLIGFLALSMSGLLDAEAPAICGVTGQLDGVVSSDSTAQTVAYVPASPAEAAAIAEGDALFKNNCAQCHAVNEKVVGPALAGISKRRSIGWLIPWVKNSSKVIATGDEYAVKLFDDNGKQQMPAFPQLSDKDVKSIVAWVNSQEGGGPSPSVSTSGTLAAN